MFNSVLLLGSLLTAPQCESIAQLTLPNTSISSARWMDAGSMATSPASGDPAGAGSATQQPSTPPTLLPAHCRVAIVLRPSSDSHIEAEVWLPAVWNGNFQAVGNGGWAGVINDRAMARAVQEGYATASTDTGHTGGSGAFAIGHPEKLIDFGYRAVHELTVQSKAIVTAYYQRAARLSYWNGCSSGGRQGLMAAQRYPGDFDAILAGAPASNPTTPRRDPRPDGSAMAWARAAAAPAQGETSRGTGGVYSLAWTAHYTHHSAWTMPVM